MSRISSGRSWPLVAVVLFFCVLGFYRISPAAPNAQQPFGNSLGQRQQIIDQLKETNRLLRQQIALLQSGRVTVVVVDKNEK